ncbi:MAG: dihydroorotase [Candidatus Methanofastidiosia archaeon]
MECFNINIITSKGMLPVRLGIKGGRMASFSTVGAADVKPSLALVPSVIDMHVHFRDFDQRHKETVASGSKAALAGGISAVCDMPNTIPPVADKKTYLRRQDLFAKDSACDYLINFCVFDEYSMSQAASVDPFFIKVYLGETTGSYVLDEALLEKVFMLQKPIALHADHSGMKKAIKFSKKYSTPLHICHVSTKDEVILIGKHKDNNITCEVTPHHLFLSGSYDVKPALCTKNDRDALWAALGGVIDIVASDHAPHTSDEKEKGAYGVSGIEAMLPLMLTALNRGQISYEAFYRCMHANQKRILHARGRDFGMDGGSRADFTIVDLGKSHTIDAKSFYSKAKHSPFDGMSVDAKVVETWVRGTPFFKDGEVVPGARGKEIRCR